MFQPSFFRTADISDMLEKVVPIPIQNQDTDRSRATCIFEETQGDMKPESFKDVSDIQDVPGF